MVAIIRGEAFGPAEKFTPTDVFQYRQALAGQLQNRHHLFFKMPFKFSKTKILRYALLPPSARLALKPADQ